MNPQEVAAILTAVAAIDDRIDPDEMRIAMWREVLDKDMPFDVAKSAVINHYATQRITIMPSDLNNVWRNERKRINEKKLNDAQLTQNPDAVFMPEGFAETFRKLTAGRQVG